MSTKSYLEPICSGCGAPLKSDGRPCWMCGIIADTAAGRTEPVLPIVAQLVVKKVNRSQDRDVAPPALAELGSQYPTFSLATLFLVMTAAAVTCGLWLEEFGYALAFLYVTVVALLVSWVRRSQKARHGQRYGWQDRVISITLSIVIAVCLAAVVIVALLVALFVVCLAGGPLLPT